MKILVSRTDSIGDVILTLPLCGWIKQNIEGASVHFLCQKLTSEIVSRSKFVDEVHIWDGALPDVDAIIHVFPNKEIAKSAKKNGIAIRVGTSHRLFHLTTCNRLVHFTRIHSPLHESQLNFKLLKGLGHEIIPSLEEIASYVGWPNKPAEKTSYLSNERFNLIFHIKSRGSAKEWKAENFLQLAERLSSHFQIILTGTQPERELIEKEIPGIFELDHVTDTTGRLSLKELINLIGQCDGLLACSTGPLHIAGVSGIKCLGLFPQKKPMHAGRWQPLGSQSNIIEETTESEGRYLDIPIEEVQNAILKWLS